MKTAEDVLIQFDCLQSSINELEECIISTNKNRFIQAMKEYAKQVAKQALKDVAKKQCPIMTYDPPKDKLYKVNKTRDRYYHANTESILNTEIKLP